MKRILFLLVLVLISASGFGAVFDPLTLGFVPMATPTLALASSAAVIVGTMPANTHSLTITVTVDTNIGGSDVAVGSTCNDYIPAGTSRTIEHIAIADPTIYLIPRTAATGTARLTAK